MNLMKTRLLLYPFLLLFLLTQVNAQKTYRAPELTTPGSWSMVLMPDPQSYVKFARNQPVLELMTAWIGENIDPLNIKMVLCTGDLVEQNDMPNPDWKNGDQPSKSQWESVSRAFGRLDGRVPYIAATGNHDFGFKSAENRQTQYDQFFPPDKNFLSQKLLREAGFNGDGNPSLTNAVYEFNSPLGQKMLFMVLEFAPRDGVLDWAKKVVAQEKYKEHFVILLTHSYLNSKSERIETEGYPLKDRNYGQAVWEKLVQPSTNIRMVFSGHIGVPDNILGHIGFRSDKNAAGKKVNQMVFNAQALGGGWHGNGGDGWLRYLEFVPGGKKIKVKTFSPLFAISPTTQQFSWRNEAYDQFEFDVD
jgi:hypothetical protein